jgi:hypothetical protein
MNEGTGRKMGDNIERERERELCNLEILLMSHADYQAIKLIKIYSMKLVRFQLAIHM